MQLVILSKFLLQQHHSMIIDCFLLPDAQHRRKQRK